LGRQWHLQLVNRIVATLKGIGSKLLRRLRRPEQKLLREYLDAPGVKKLHIGCGNHILDGWLNCDLVNDWQIVSGVPIYPLDATKPFPFRSGIFDGVFSEHMIEHVPYSAGCLMLQECFRVLKAGGRIRISTPNLRFLIDLYDHPRDDYISWITDQWIQWAPIADRTFVINNFFRFAGHQFIYDEPTLSAALCESGFVNIARQKLQESNFEAFSGLENENRMPPGFLSLETLVLEANKP
jgi:predicted SAM-dependent methyltransferase